MFSKDRPPSSHASGCSAAATRPPALRRGESRALLLATHLCAAAAGLQATGARHPCVSADGAALASCFGWNATDGTDVLHSAFSSGATRLTIDDVEGQPWLVRPLSLADVNDLHVTFAAGVTLLAKQDEFHGLDDCLLRLSNVTNIVLSGKAGSKLRMRRDDYAGEFCIK